MYWWVNITALCLMCALLEISPSKLAQISHHTLSYQWHLVSYLTLFICVLLLLIKYLLAIAFRSLQVNKRPIGLNDIDFDNKHFTNKALTDKDLVDNHLNQKHSLTKWQDIITFTTTLSVVVVFFIAIISSTMAQRLELIEHSVSQTLYVEAIVTPVSLSDRQFEFSDNVESLYQQTGLDDNLDSQLEIKLESKNEQNPAKLTQGYRLLATLTDIAYYDSVDFGSESTAQTINNPFASDTFNSHKGENVYLNVPNNAELFNPHSDTSLPPTTSMTVLITSHQPQLKWLNEFAPTQSIRMQLALNPIDIATPNNPHEFNEYRWLSSRHASAKATIIDADSKDVNAVEPNFKRYLNQYRFYLRQHIQQLWEKNYNLVLNDHFESPNDKLTTSSTKQQAMAVTLSLLTGDRSLINKETTALYRFAGISHLLAISGAHVLFLAILAAWIFNQLTVLIIPNIYRHLGRWQLQFWVAVSAAFVYAMFAGFDVPAARTAWMLLLVGMVRNLLIGRSTFKVLLGLATFMAWQDVFVLWQAGFWLSFVAVSLLVAYTYRHKHKTKIVEYSDWRTRIHQPDYITIWGYKSDSPFINKVLSCAIKSIKILREFILLQLWMTIALLPISLWLFGKVSLWGLLVNMVAIGFFGWIVVPFNLLAGLLYPLLPSVSNSIWLWLFDLLNSFHDHLYNLQSLTNQSGWLYTEISLPMLFVAIMSITPWLLPKGIFSRWLSLPPSFMLLMMIVSSIAHNKSPAPNSVTIEPLPLKHKSLSATLLTTPSHQWLFVSAYPTGNSFYNSELNLSLPADKDIALQILEALKRRHIDALTGIIIQTPTQTLANSAVYLGELLPINYYWLAGHDHLDTTTSPNIENDMQPHASSSERSHLTPSACEVGQSWRNDINKTHFISIQAITGWQTIADKKVWSCSLQITTDYEVYLVDNMQTLSDTIKPGTIKPSTIKPDTIENNAQSDTLSNLNELHVNSKNDDHQKLVAMPATTSLETKLVINSSQDAMPWQLWQLLCPADDLSNQYSVNTTIQAAKIDSSTLQNHHWLSPPQAYLNKELVHQVNPLSLHILYPDKPVSLIQQDEAKLYWQQVINNRHLEQ